MPKEVIKNQKSIGAEAVSKWQLQVGWAPDQFVQVGAVDQDEPLRSGQFFTLDRHEINKLIRVLRRARDAAYGADA